MKVFILAAGLGKRMDALTHHCPKPLLPIHGVPMLLILLNQLKEFGYDHFVINVSRFPEQFQQQVGHGEKLGIKIEYSYEGEEPLNTADGIRRALHLLGDDEFLLVNADVFCSIDYGQLKLDIDRLAHIVLVKNPFHNPAGDFILDSSGDPMPTHAPNHPDCGSVDIDTSDRLYTYSGIAVISPALLLEAFGLEFNSFADLLAVACEHRLVSATVFDGAWLDIGTPERLKQFEALLDRPSV